MGPYCVLASGTHEVRVCMTVREDYTSAIPVLSFLHAQLKLAQYSGTARGFASLFERYASAGRTRLTSEMFHQVDSKNNIWEFVRGDIRIFCFKDGTAVVLTHATIKKTQKVNPQDVITAVSTREGYFRGRSI